MDIERLKQAKKACGLTYEELSKNSGVPISTLYDIFRGITLAPRIDTVQAIEKALGLSNDITTEEYAAGWRNTATVQITPDEDDILDKYRELKQILGEKKGADLVKSLLDNLIGSLQKP